MPEVRIARAVESYVVGVSVGADTRWTWRIMSRDGQLLQESPRSFPSLSDALKDGRRHLADATWAQPPSSETPSDRRMASRLIETERNVWGSEGTAGGQKSSVDRA